MLKPLLELYYRIQNEINPELVNRNLQPIQFIDVYRSQPVDPELYEYFPIPAIFVDYTMKGQGIKQPRLVTTMLHIVTDQLPSASNISSNIDAGLQRFIYNAVIQLKLEGKPLGKTNALKFISEDPIDIPVANYHVQSYEFNAYINEMVEDVDQILGEFERLKIYRSLINNV